MKRDMQSVTGPRDGSVKGNIGCFILHRCVYLCVRNYVPDMQKTGTHTPVPLLTHK